MCLRNGETLQYDGVANLECVDSILGSFFDACWLSFLCSLSKDKYKKQNHVRGKSRGAGEKYYGYNHPSLRQH